MSEICNKTIYSIKVQSCWTSEKRSSVNEFKGFKGNQKHFSGPEAGIHCQGEITYMVNDILVLYNESAVFIDRFSNSANSQYSICQHNQLIHLPNQ